MVTGAYRVKYRPLFRPIQYIYSCLEKDNLVWEARTIVMNSCLHVEKSYKYFFGISEGNKGSLGVLLNNNPNNIALDPLLLKIITNLNNAVYGKSKHTIEHIDIDAHDFSPADGIAIYLVCRWIGVKLLEPTGLFNDWKKK